MADLQTDLARLTRFFVAGNETVTYAVAQVMKRAGRRQVRDIKAANLVVTYFTAEPDLEDAYFDSEGLVQLANPGTFLVDLSPASPHFADELFAVTSVSDLRFVAAPLVVLDPAAEEPFAKENLVCYLGGEGPDTQVVGHLLGEFAKMVGCGSAADAQMVRAAHTIAQTARLVAAVETEALFRAVNEGGLDVTDGFARARRMLPPDDIREAVLRAVLAKEFDGDYTVEMLCGEIEAALVAADDVDLILPQLEAAMSLVELLEVIEERPLAPAALSLLFADQEEGRRNGLDWARSEEFFAQGGAGGEGDDEDGHDHGHVHLYDHDHDHDHAHAHAHGAPYGAIYEEDQPYGFDRFDLGRLGADDED